MFLRMVTEDEGIEGRAAPMMRGLFRIAQREKWVCSSAVVKILLPTSIISRSGQRPGAAKDVEGTAWFTIRYIVFQDGIMSLVIRHVFPMAGAHAEGKSTPHSQTAKRILRPVFSSALLIVDMRGEGEEDGV